MVHSQHLEISSLNRAFMSVMEEVAISIRQSGSFIQLRKI